jgi:hypothetical protein
MIRNLKVLLAAATALAAFGAFSASAHAAEEKFHCSVEPCRATLLPDEAASTTTAHHVFVVKGKTAGGFDASVSFTCNQLTGEATSNTQTTTELTFTNLRYENAAGEQKCKVGASETLALNFTSCDYNFTSTGGSTSTAQIHVFCGTAGDGIDLSVKGTTCLQITPFTSTGLGYHDSNIGGAKHLVTATANVVVPAAALDLKNVGNANCAALNLVSVTSSIFTTGNTLVTTETDTVPPIMANAWFE